MCCNVCHVRYERSQTQPDNHLPRLLNKPLTLQLAHLSDPHLTSPDRVRWRELANKRLLGYLSWKYRRKHKHRAGVLEALVRDIASRKPDHITVTGDLTQIGTAMECDEAYSWLKTLGSPDQVSVIPGNHDVYAADDWMRTIGVWSPYMFGIEPGTEQLFPAVHEHGSVALIGLSTAVPTAPFMATGSLGERQLSQLDELLTDLAERKLFRVILIHHGPVPGTNSFRRRLTDAGRFLDVLKQRGCELVLHGHGHHNLRDRIETASADIPVFGVSSASMATNNPVTTATWNSYTIEQRDRSWRLTVQSRSYDPDSHEFTDAGIPVQVDFPES